MDKDVIYIIYIYIIQIYKYILYSIYNSSILFYIYIHTHTHTLLSYKKKEILTFATTWMDLEGIMLNEISQMEKDKYHMISCIC